ncbi:MAG TPA: HD domain-containing phosphohydrolase, partial [Actinomycetes bacterium]|nr:HD domain-containing phosphohydrolase [Actinomycetes bacterium]
TPRRSGARPCSTRRRAPRSCPGRGGGTRTPGRGWWPPGRRGPGLEYAFLLHDLGKIGVPDAVLNKAGPLTDEEWALMREHPAIGLRILEGVPHMDVVRAVVYSHHERWDGAGYPEGLKGEQIPLAARVFAAVDAFDAITTDRPYRVAATLEEALHRLREASGTQFAPDAVEAIHLVDRGRLAAIQATAGRGR